MYAREDSPQPTTTRLAQTSDGMTLAAENVRMHERMVKTTKKETAASVDPLLVAETVAKAIDTEWKGSITELAEKAGCDDTSIHGLKSKGASKKSTVLKKICKVMNLDPDAIMAGEIRKTSHITNESNDDIVELAERLKGSRFETAIRAMMQAFVKETL